MATLSGQMLVSHRHLPDDVVEAFIRLAAEAGIGIFRLLDPLNNVANLATAIRAAKAAGASVEGVVVCSDAGVPPSPPWPARWPGWAATPSAFMILWERPAPRERPRWSPLRSGPPASPCGELLRPGGPGRDRLPGRP